MRTFLFGIAVCIMSIVIVKALNYWDKSNIEWLEKEMKFLALTVDIAYTRLSRMRVLDDDILFLFLEKTDKFQARFFTLYWTYMLRTGQPPGFIRESEENFEYIMKAI